MTTFEERLKDTLSHSCDIERELGGGGMSRAPSRSERILVCRCQGPVGALLNHHHPEPCVDRGACAVKAGDVDE